CFRLDGKGVTVEIDEDYRKQVASKARSYGFTIDGPHDLAGWARLLGEIKKHIRPDCDRELLQQVRTKAETIYEHWRIEMRYRATQATGAQLKAVREAASWIRSKYEKIVKK